MPSDATSAPDRSTDEDRRPRPRRLHPLVLGLVSAVVSLVAGVGAALVFVAVAGDDVEPRPEPELVLRLGPDDADDFVEPEVDRSSLPAASFELLDGGEASLADYRGRPLVINMWASTCPPCVAEMPALHQVSTEHADHVTFLGLAMADDPAASRAMVDETGVGYDIGLDRSGAIGTELGTVALPTTFFVDADGTVVERKTGAMSIDEIRRRVEELVG